MKRLSILLLAFVLICALFACGQTTPAGSDDPLGRDDKSKGQTEASGPEDDLSRGGVITRQAVTFEALLNYIETGSTEMYQPRVLTDAEKQELKESVEKEGGTIAFDADGTIRITGDGQTSIILHPDGSCSGTDADGKPFGFETKKEWPDSAFGKAVPKADFEIKMQVEDEDGLMLMFDNVTYEQAKAYGKQLSALFAVNPSEIDMKENGMYSYSGMNENGLLVEFSFMDSAQSKTCGLSVGKHEDDPGDTSDVPGGQTGTPAELPPQFAFLSPDSSYSVYDADGYYSIEKAGATLAEAKEFTAKAVANGYEKRSENVYKNEDGSDAYVAVLTTETYEIHVMLNTIEPKLFVDLLEINNSGAQQPDGNDQWPVSGPLTRIPKPDFGTGFTIRDEGEVITASVSGAKESDFAPYMQRLKDAGFTLSPQYEDEDDMLYYEAHDAEGYDAYVNYVFGVFVVGVTTMPE